MKRPWPYPWTEAYEGKVFVVDNQRVSVTQYQSVKDALMLAAQGADGARIKERLEETKGDSVIFITVDTLKYLKKGGRITPAAAALGTLLKIKPVLIILGEKLDAFAKARTMKQARTLMLNSIQKELETRLGRQPCQYSLWPCPYTERRGGGGVPERITGKISQCRYYCGAAFPEHLLPYRTGKPGGDRHEKDGRGI